MGSVPTANVCVILDTKVPIAVNVWRVPRVPVALNAAVMRVASVTTVRARAKPVGKVLIVPRKHPVLTIVPTMVFACVENVNVLRDGLMPRVRHSNPVNPVLPSQKMPKTSAVAMAFVSVATACATLLTKVSNVN